MFKLFIFNFQQKSLNDVRYEMSWKYLFLLRTEFSYLSSVYISVSVAFGYQFHAIYILLFNIGNKYSDHELDDLRNGVQSLPGWKEFSPLYTIQISSTTYPVDTWGRGHEADRASESELGLNLISNDAIYFL
jgi:hypothetical protein